MWQLASVIDGETLCSYIKSENRSEDNIHTVCTGPTEPGLVLMSQLSRVATST